MNTTTLGPFDFPHPALPAKATAEQQQAHRRLVAYTTRDSSNDLARGLTVTYHEVTQAQFEAFFGRKM
jgi:hypothetical protein